MQTEIRQNSVLASGKAILPRFSPHSTGSVTRGSRGARLRRSLKTGDLEGEGWSRSPPREAATEAGCWGVWPPSEHAVRGSPRRERGTKSARKELLGCLLLRNPVGRSQNLAGLRRVSGKSSPRAVCPHPSNPAPQYSLLLTLLQPPLGGR